MEIQNTKSFQEFIESQEISADKEKDIEQMIGAFSEYLVAVNPEYIRKAKRSWEHDLFIKLDTCYETFNFFLQSFKYDHYTKIKF